MESTYGQSNSYIDAGLAPPRPSSNDLLLWDNTSTMWQRAEIISVSGKVLQLNTVSLSVSRLRAVQSSSHCLRDCFRTYHAFPIKNRKIGPKWA